MIFYGKGLFLYSSTVAEQSFALKNKFFLIKDSSAMVDNSSSTVAGKSFVLQNDFCAIKDKSFSVAEQSFSIEELRIGTNESSFMPGFLPSGGRWRAAFKRGLLPSSADGAGRRDW